MANLFPLDMDFHLHPRISFGFYSYLHDEYQFIFGVDRRINRALFETLRTPFCRNRSCCRLTALEYLLMLSLY
jgi:hypothetical protein